MSNVEQIAAEVPAADAVVPAPADAGAEEASVQEGSGGEVPAKHVAAAPPNPKKKRKVAVLMAYQGHGYAGMQRNPGVKTIEEDLFRAIHTAGGISELNSDETGFSKLHWMRAARTDKGVSAVGQVVSLRMVLEDPDIKDRINAALPDQVRVFGFGRATHGFDARKHCDKRRYEYILPAWAFDPALVPASSLMGEEVEGEEGVAAAVDCEAGPMPGEEDEDGTSLPQEDDVAAAAANEAGVMAAVDTAAGPEAAAPVATEDTGFVFDEACTARMTAILSVFEGTHNFHNFTVRTPASAPNARRYILSFRRAGGRAVGVLLQVLPATLPPGCCGAFTIAGQPWVRLVVIGQSFMLHQIRKMVGLAMAIYRGAAPIDAITLALRTRVGLSGPMAPELGLFLDECYYDSYNTQFGKLHGEIHLSDFQAQVDDFKATQLYPHIAARDAEEGVNAAWFATLTDRYYRFRCWRHAVTSGTPMRRTEGKRPYPGAATGTGGVSGRQHQHQQRGGGGSREGRGGTRGRGPGGRGGDAKRTRFGRAKGAPAGGKAPASYASASAAAEYSD